MFQVILLFIIGYLLGSIPSGVWIGKLLYKTDIREFGSKNSGTTNTFRVLGKNAGIIVFLMDMLKGAVPAWIAIYLNTPIHPIWFGLAAILGHIYPIFARFKGGKAVATGAGVGFALYPIFVLFQLIVWLIVLYLSSMVSLASMITFFIAFLSSFFLSDLIFSIALFIILAVVVIRHKTNIIRIKNGTENKVPFGRNQKNK